ncbi:ribosomal protein S18-alanine N-acetyltransferase [Halosegnis sp.]|uniref:ribosomal protein S18-alanine N-acetyltransferase n=1 Tax=Halosegnis sp. TaxID=2864959 RepID=UPI0035D455FC
MTTPAPDDETTTVRPATRADLLTVYRIEKASFPQPWPFAAFEGFLGEPGFLIAARGGEVVGYVVADTVPNAGRALGHVKDIAVHPDHRGRGVGAQLLGRALRVMRGERASRVKLEVRESNDAAIRLYRRFGFEFRRTLPRYYDDGEDAYVMIRELQ